MSDFAPLTPAQTSVQTTQKQHDTKLNRPLAHWRVRPVAPPEKLATLMRELEIPPLLAGVLWARGFREDALATLEPPLALTQIPDLDAAAARLEHALKTKKRITIHGDYDADGITGTAILTLGLRELGAQVHPFIPHRMREGYGIAPERVDEHIATSDLFVTVDCGISNLPEIARLQAAGVEVIVSDHHHPGQDLPDCLIVHPKMSPLAQAGMPELTGSGVAYHLLWALRLRLGLEAPLEYSDLASIGIIADVAPLMGENRALVRAGLAQLPASRWPGLTALVQQTGLKRTQDEQREITATDVAFVLAPRLNAAGRMGEADLGLELLMTASERRARELAVYLHARNSERKNVQNNMFAEAITRVNNHEPAIIVADDNWHAGVMGIVASKLLERFFKPVFIIAGDKGSVRSTPGISAVQALQHAATSLKRFGGHSQAAGFTLEPDNTTNNTTDNIATFRDAINDFVSQHPSPQPVTILDTLISPADMTWEVLSCLQQLEPFGQGHRAPLFGFCGQVDTARAVGQDAAHLQLRISGVKGIAWQRGDQAAQLPPRTGVNVAISLRENEWRGVRSIEFEAQDIRQAELLVLADVDELALPLRFDVKRGAPPADVNAVRVTKLEHLPTPANTTATTTSTATPTTSTNTPAIWHLSALPVDDSVTPTQKLRQGLVRLVEQGLVEQKPSQAAGVTGLGVTGLYVDLSAEALQTLEHLAATFPDVAAVRQTYVHIKRGTHKTDGVFGERCLTILRELDLVDDLGRAKIGVKRNPYTSVTLEKGLLEQYRLRRFIQAYQYLDDAGFARAFQALFLADQ